MEKIQIKINSEIHIQLDQVDEPLTTNQRGFQILYITSVGIL